MDETGKALLKLMFKPGEKVCVSPNKYGYHSIALETVLDSDSVTLVPTPESVQTRNEKRAERGHAPISWEDSFESCQTKDLLLVALNPIDGYRTDSSATAYRSFLVEVDYGPIKEQIEYLKRIGLPYSALVFSGNKSIHALITLDQDLPSYSVYYHFAEWILGVATMADQKTKNPSRSIRIPGAMRDTGKQRIVEMRGTVSLQELAGWLKLHPDAKPPEKEIRTINTEGPDPTKIKAWVAKRLLEGLDPTKGRNQQWFAIACEYALAGYSIDDTLDLLLGYFQPDRDFKQREWETSVKSAFKYIYERK